MIKHFHFIALFAFFIGMSCQLSACGQKGRIYVPITPPPDSTPYPTAAPKEKASNSDVVQKANP